MVVIYINTFQVFAFVCCPHSTSRNSLAELRSKINQQRLSKIIPTKSLRSTCLLTNIDHLPHACDVRTVTSGVSSFFPGVTKIQVSEPLVYPTLSLLLPERSVLWQKTEMKCTENHTTSRNLPELLCKILYKSTR